MTLDIILTAVGAILMVVGIIGCIVPVLPGVVLNYVGILLLHFSSRVEFSMEFLVGWSIVVVAIEVLDYYIPIWGTKKFGGGKKGAWGCTIGVVAGIFILPPWGIIICPFVGAVIGELLDKKETKQALKAGLGAFVGFLAGTFLQVVVALVLTFIFVKEAIVAWF